MLVLNPGEIHVFQINLAAYLGNLNIRESLLSPDEITRANQFRIAEAKTQFIITRSCLREILSFYIRLYPHELKFAYTKHFKPYLLNSDIQFNVAHSGDIALIAVAKNDSVGIDIEKITTRMDLKIAKRFFNKIEYQELIALPQKEQHHAFYSLWARKEALVKALGKGLYLSLASFVISLEKTEANVLVDGVTCYLRDLQIDQDHKAALASLQPIKKLTWQTNWESK